ncbi:hypothetical protein [Algoriphagus machipongonensis]|uniref:Protein SirB1 N-terminal domain-containing protein n=1 Tax=Algoriphagus machipongonensis TaxID=388413 RepID=A3HTY2_9BACT|nr:hypothetical protein [Algoriphagus machipongonensis]EAZ81604.1 hypothetical protein ALPR1_00145 [Algoriphagus machipongonensis]
MPALEELHFETDLERQIWENDKNDPLQLFKAIHAENIENDKWHELVADLDKKRAKTNNEYNLLRSIFEKSHKYLLKNYVQHSTFNQMLETGDFDCVSGSATLGILLERYGFDFDIVETDYHVFIMVNLDGENLILESTLPIGGLITKSSEVKKYLDSYNPKEFAQLTSLTQRLGSPDIDFSEHAIFRKVSLVELAGLQYYNDAISHFNEQSFGLASKQLSKALLLYESERIKALRELAIEQAYKVYGYDLK